MAGSSSTVIKLESSDGRVFEVNEAVALQSEMLKAFIQADEHAAKPVRPIPLPMVTGKILSRIINYCRKHAEAEANDADLEAFDVNFVNVKESILFSLCQAADYLNVKSLVELTCEAIARIAKDKTPVELRQMFNVNVTPREDEEAEVAVRREFRMFFQ